MSQMSFPFADVSNTGWGPTPTYPHVGTVTPNDGSPVACPLPPGGSFVVQLRPLATPARPGAQTLTVRLDETLPSQALVTFLLLQVSAGNTSTVAGASVQPTGTLTNYDLALTDAEIASIGNDYTNLRVRVIAASEGAGSYYGSGIGSRVPASILTPCCPGAIPATLYLTILGPSGWPLNGAQVVLTYQGSTGDWRGTDSSSCGLLWVLSCNSETNLFGLVAYNGPFLCSLIPTSTTQSCPPSFQVQITAVGFTCGGFCASNGPVTLTVTS